MIIFAAAAATAAAQQQKKISPSGRYNTVGHCPHCSKHYFSRQAMRKHVRTKHPQPVPTYLQY